MSALQQPGAARAGRQRVDDAASGSRRPSTTPPGATSPAATRHGKRSGRSASSPQAEDHRTSGRPETGSPGTGHGTALSRASAQVTQVFGTHTQTARRWATRRRPESREPLRPVAARQKPQATAGRRRELQIEAARQIPLYLDLPTVVVDPGLPRLPRRERPPGSRGRRPGVGPVLAGSAGRGRRRADVVKYWTGTVPVQDGARRRRGVARGRGRSRVTVGVQAGRRCWGWCCR